MRCISIINQKGGCGKTTVAINLASCLAVQGKRTLLVDMDPQSHCAVGLAVPEDQIEKSIYDVLISPYSTTKTTMKEITWQIGDNFDLAPAGIELAALEPQLAGREQRENCLRNVLQSLRDIYDYVIIDCPPSVGILTFNALRASNRVIVPVETGYFSLHGLARQLETLVVLRQQCGQKIDFNILPCMYDVRTKLAREVLHELKKLYGNQMFETIINFNTKLKEAASLGQPINEYDPASKGMKDFMSLAQEVILTDQQNISQQEDIYEVERHLESISKSATELLSKANSIFGRDSTTENLAHESISNKSQTSKTQLNMQQKSGDKTHASKYSQETIQQKIDRFYGVRANQGKVTFAAMYPKADKVQIAGDFNGWQPEKTPLVKKEKDGRWTANLELPRGVYQYRYVVDGRWQQDPYNDKIQPNEFGEFNSVLEVK